MIWEEIIGVSRGVGARFRELRLEVVLVTKDELDELEELDELGYAEEYEGAVGRGGGGAVLPSAIASQLSRICWSIFLNLAWPTSPFAWSAATFLYSLLFSRL